jgi:hypothetical protein
LSFWSGRAAGLRLSESGRVALAGIFDSNDVEVLVQWADELGLWVLQQEGEGAAITVVLVKWAHFETAVVDVVVLEQPQKPKVLGFDTWKSRNQT